MRSFSRNEKTNDLILAHGSRFSVSDGAYAVGGALDAIVKTVRGELAFDTLRGVPYFTTVFQGVISLPEWEEEMRTAIRSCPHVTELVSFETKVDRESGTISYTATVETDEGEVSASGTLGNGHWNVAQENSVGDIDGYVLGERTVYQADATVIIVNVQTSGNSFSLRVKTVSGASVSVSWGDGGVSAGVSSDSGDTVLTHQYAKNGSYVIEISSGVGHFAIGASDSSSDSSKPMLTGVRAISMVVNDVSNSFSHCSNLVGSVPKIPSGVTDMSKCFKGCVGLAGEVPAWSDMVTDVSECYYGCTGLTGVIPEWGGAITDAESCYCGCVNMNGTWTDDYSKLMPTTIVDHANCVTGCSRGVRSKFKTLWGGLIRLLDADMYGDFISVINGYTGSTALVDSDDGSDLLDAINDILVETGSAHPQMSDSDTVYEAENVVNSFP